MMYAGVDIGSRAAKAVLLEDDKIISSVIRDTGAESVKTSGSCWRIAGRNRYRF